MKDKAKADLELRYEEGWTSGFLYGAFIGAASIIVPVILYVLNSGRLF